MVTLNTNPTAGASGLTRSILLPFYFTLCGYAQPQPRTVTLASRSIMQQAASVGAWPSCSLSIAAWPKTTV